MKRLLAFILCAVMVLSLAACSGNQQSGGNASANTGTNSSNSETSGNNVAQTADNAENPYAVPELNWPNDTITIWCGYSAGGSSDLACRAMADALSRRLGVNVIVENQPGSNSWQCWTAIQQTIPKDGNNLTLVNTGIVTGKYDPINPRPYYVDDFSLLAAQVVDYEGIAIRIDDNRFTDMDSMVEYGKNNELYITASSGYFAGDGCIAQWLNKTYGTNFVVVPVDGSGDQRTMFLAGDTDILIGNVSDLMASGYGTEWKIICTFSDERTAQTPDVPTGKELGYDYFGFSARGFAYAKGVDERIVEAMRSAMIDIFENDTTYMDYMTAQGNNMELWLGDDWVAKIKERAQSNIDVWDLGVTVE